MALSLIAALTIVSFFSAGISGFVGSAGGQLLLGAMLFLGVDLKVAVPVHAIVQLVSTNSRTVALLPNVRWRSIRTRESRATPSRRLCSSSIGPSADAARHRPEGPRHEPAPR